jgi:hypothetical protein
MKRRLVLAFITLFELRERRPVGPGGGTWYELASLSTQAGQGGLAVEVDAAGSQLPQATSRR